MLESDISIDMLPQEPVGLFYAWWRGDMLPDLEVPEALTLDLDPAHSILGTISGLKRAEIERRYERQNRVVTGFVDGHPAASGWSSGGRVEIGELGLDFQLPPGNRYLWDFVTLPAYRGRGIYPALLRAFIDHESDVERFWVGHDLDNVASSRGILKAGFQTVGEVYAVEELGPIFVASGSAATRASEAAELLGIPLVEQHS